MLTDPEFMTVTEVAAMLRLSKPTVYRLIRNGELDAHQIGRSFRVPAAAVTACLKATRTREQAGQ